ncbi:MAG: DUF262 domain-containing protein [Coleofasciculus sp. C1-SOL-03]|jgi:hypothetical protein|uniref:DUF262 domain-containing protein n=1 Tax=Coleofasciculus sp. C1-SOL-03 TaxID=3069522 RepID=UPI003303219D
MQLAPAEKTMWETRPAKDPKKMSDDEINAKYEKREKRILTEMNREKLPSFADALKKPGYMEIRPFFQRRPRWNKKMQSRLIESFLINIPVPPIILYEKEYNSYEVMDGQQRITTIQDFYDNKLELTDLELWPELEGRTYNQLPKKIKAGIDRRSISSIVLITESAPNQEEALYLKQLAFERLNTGGVDLSRQEVRNCLYYGDFNKLLLELAQNPIFTKAWGIPIDDKEELERNSLYKKMEDVELVLRFFALRHTDKFHGKLEEFLDKYMIKSLNFAEKDIAMLRDIFLKTIDIVYRIYGDNLFNPKPFEPRNMNFQNQAYKTYYEAVMVGFSNHLDSEDVLIARKQKIIEATQKLFEEDKNRLLTGKGKAKADIQKRLELFDDMLNQVINK